MPAHGLHNPWDTISAVNSSVSLTRCGLLQRGQLDHHTHTHTHIPPLIPPPTSKPLPGPNKTGTRCIIKQQCRLSRLSSEDSRCSVTVPCSAALPKNSIQLKSSICIFLRWEVQISLYTISVCVCVCSLCRHSMTLCDCSYTRWHESLVLPLISVQVTHYSAPQVHQSSEDEGTSPCLIFLVSSLPLASSAWKWRRPGWKSKTHLSSVAHAHRYSNLALISQGTPAAYSSSHVSQNNQCCWISTVSFVLPTIFCLLQHTPSIYATRHYSHPLWKYTSESRSAINFHVSHRCLNKGRRVIGSVCLPFSKITQKLPGQFLWDMMDGCSMGQGIYVGFSCGFACNRTKGYWSWWRSRLSEWISTF